MFYNPYETFRTSFNSFSSDFTHFSKTTHTRSFPTVFTHFRPFARVLNSLDTLSVSATCLQTPTMRSRATTHFSAAYTCFLLLWSHFRSFERIFEDLYVFLTTINYQRALLRVLTRPRLLSTIWNLYNVF